MSPDVEGERAEFVDLLLSEPCDRCGTMLGSINDQMFHPLTGDRLCGPCALVLGVVPIGPVHGSDEPW